MRVARDQKVHVKLALHNCKALQITGWYHLVTMEQTNSELTHLHDFCVRIGYARLVEVASHDVHVGCERLQVIVGLFCAQVARTQNVLNFSRYQQLLELGRYSVTPVRNVAVADHEHQLQCEQKTLRCLLIESVAR